MSDTTEVIITAETILLLEEGTTVISTGEAGPQGAAGIYVGPTPPANTSILWVDTS